MKQFLKESEDLSKQVSQKKFQNLEIKKQKEVFESELKMRPQFRRKFQQGYKTFGFTTSYEQNLPLGMKASLGVENDFDFDDSLNKNHRQFTFSLEAPLGKNRGDALRFYQEQKAKKRYQSIKNRYKDLLYQQCQKAIERYLVAYHSKKKKKIQISLLENAKKLAKYQKKSFQRKEIRKIEYLSAKTDALSRKEAVIQAQKNYSVNQSKLLSQISKKNINSLTNPMASLKKWTSGKKVTSISQKALKSHPQVRAKYWDLNASEANVSLVKEQSKSDIDLFIQTQHNQTPVNQITQQETTIETGIQFAFPIMKDQYQYNIDQALEQKRQKTLSRKNILEKLQLEAQTITQTLESLDQKIENIKNQTKFLKEKMKLGFKALKRGRIDFQSYQIHRDQFLQKKLNLINLNQSYWNRWIQYLSLREEMPKGCHL